VSVRLLEEYGPQLPFPHSSGLRALSIVTCVNFECSTEAGRCEYFMLDPRRTAILLLGADKTGDDRWYEAYVPRADRLYDRHLRVEKDG